MKTIVLLLALGTATVFAQGILTPPSGAPVAGMKTLTQVEPRTPIETLPITISTSGSYYFTQNLQFTATSGDAISITSPNVTLDLNGFTLSSTAGVTGRGISVTGGLNNVTIRNGKIAGNSTVSPATIAGFDNGIYANASGGIPFGAFRNLTVEDMQVSGCRTFGIVAYYGTVTHCTVAANGGEGLSASESVITGCIAKYNGGHGIFGSSSTVNNSLAISNAKDGIVVSGSITGCVAQGNNTSAGAYYDLNATNAVIVSTKYGTGNVTGSSIDGERRTPIESLPFTINTSGSYYLAKNLQFTATSGDAISITTPNVTLDLNGFTLSSTAGVTGRGIFVTGGLNNVTIRNGKIAGNSTVSPAAIAGFDNGIYANASGGIPFGAFRNLTLENMQVSGCRTFGIVAYYSTVTHCTIAANGTDGLSASESVVTGCIAKYNGGNGIFGSSITLTNSVAISNGGDGIRATSGNVTNCTATGNHTAVGTYYDLNATDAVIAFTKYGTGNVTGSTLTGNKTP